jgi:hypothetical protein
MSHEIKGTVKGTTVGVEFKDNGAIEICTDAPSVCCVAFVKLEKEQVKELIRVLQLQLNPPN